MGRCNACANSVYQALLRCSHAPGTRLIPTKVAHTDTRTHMHTHARMHTHTHTQRPPGPRKDMKTTEVAEESEGWFRLRTIPVAWSSDEEEGGRRGVPEDLRHKLKVRGRVGE